MCQINLKISSSSNLQSAEGRYKPQSSSTWIPFTVNLNNAQTPDINTIGIYDLQIKVQGSNGIWSDWKTDTFSVLENCGNTGNSAPYADAGVNQSTSGTGVILDGTNSLDPDGIIVSYSWSQISGPIATISDNNQAQTSVSLLSDGTYVFQLKVTDNEGTSDTDTVEVIKKREGGGGECKKYRIQAIYVETIQYLDCDGKNIVIGKQIGSYNNTVCASSRPILEGSGTVTKIGNCLIQA